MSELAGEVTDGNHELKAKELAQVSRRLRTNASLLASLRGTLTQLRARATKIRSMG